MDDLYTYMQTNYLTVARYVFVALVLGIVLLLRRRLLLRQKADQVLAVLDIDNGAVRLPIMHYEITIGRSKSCDVVIPLSVVSRQHAVLTMDETGRWRITDTKSMGGILLNGEPLRPEMTIGIGDEISLAGITMALMPATSYDADEVLRAQKKRRLGFKPTKRRQRLQQRSSVAGIFLLLNLFQAFAFYQFYLVMDDEHLPNLSICFGFMAVFPWVYLLIAKVLKLKNISAETTAFFLSTIGLCITASAAPSSLLKQLYSMILGLVIFCVMCVVLQNLQLVMKLRKWAGAASLGLLVLNIVIGTAFNGQKNWIDLGFITVQPSEFVKILFVFTGAATLEWLLTAKNLIILTGYAVGCIGCLFLMGDFGTALIFFFTFIVLIFMTSGDIRAIVLTVVTAGLGAGMIVSYRPYIIQRFSAWRHVWEHMNDSGYQQTRALIAIASGGLLGLGGGNGVLKKIFAADTDLVFGVLCEEWGLLIGLLTISCYVMLLLCAIRSAKTTRSSYYVIAACAAASLFLFQASLNIFGTVDILPLTGVTLPFISNGGSSIAASWGLLSFITAANNYAKPKKAKLLTAPVAVGAAAKQKGAAQ